MLTLGFISTAFALFGDGNPTNGFEDDRELLSTAEGVLAEIPNSVGAIHCEVLEPNLPKGTVQVGSGVLIYKPQNQNHIGLLTVAHNFWYLPTSKELDDCALYLNGNKGVKIPLPKHLRIYPKSWLYEGNKHDNDIALVKLPAVSKKVNLKKYGAMPIKNIPENNAEYTLEDSYKAGMKVELIAYSTKHEGMSVSRKDCRIVIRKRGDFYYGDESVYIHSCDTSCGSSGGALVGTLNGQSSILGIHRGIERNFSFYSCDFEKYPEKNGLVEGMPFDPSKFTGLAINFNNRHFKEIYDQL